MERDLGNTLERLFLEFEEKPVRSGTYSPSRIGRCLPGNRPALVVVDRPAVFRDLVAMRPVADLIRRRLGNRLPLNPFGRSSQSSPNNATHRRDMFFAAQTVQRLHGLDRILR